MNKIIALYKKEINTYLVSPIAYIFVMMFLVIAGLFFWVDLGDTRQASLRHTFMVVRSILLFVTPMLTMRLFAEEKKSGTIELLFTSPISNSQLVIAKFLSATTVYAMMFALTLAYPIIISSLGHPDFWPMVTGYLGLFLITGCYTSVGLFASSLSENQLIAGILSFGILLSFLVIDWLIIFVSHPVLNSVFTHLSFFEHGEGFDKGILSLTDITYYLGVTFIFLSLCIRSLEIQRNR